jgi:hypothetical protein
MMRNIQCDYKGIDLSKIRKNRTRWVSFASGAAALAATATLGTTTPAYAAGTLRFEEFKTYGHLYEMEDNSPYFVVFVGKPDGTTSTTMVRKPWWDNNVVRGYVSKPQQTVSSSAGNGSFVAVTLVEEDGDPDLYQAKITSINSELNTAWQSVKYSDDKMHQYYTITQRLSDEVDDRLGNDDNYGTDGTWVTTQNGWLDPLSFSPLGPEVVKVWLRVV